MSTAVATGAVVDGRTPDRRLMLLAASAPLVFLAGQVAMEWRHVELVRSIVTERGLAPVPITARDVAMNVGWSLLLYGALATGGIALAARGYRWAWAAPAVIFVLGAAVGWGHHPQPIGAAWSLPQVIDGRPIAHWYSQPWGGSITDLVLVLLPAAPFALAARGRRPGWHADRAAALAFLLVATGIAIVFRANAVVNDSIAGPVVLATACSFGLLAGTKRPWWPWATLLVSMGVAGTLGSVVWILFPSAGVEATAWSQVTGLLPDVVPVAACALVASCWEPLSDALRRRPTAA